MDKITSVLAAVEAYGERHGIKPATVVRKATRNPRLYERLKLRRDQLDEDLTRIAEYIGLAPPSSDADAGTVPNSTSSGAFQGERPENVGPMGVE
jgi:hypothetical protein